MLAVAEPPGATFVTRTTSLDNDRLALLVGRMRHGDSDALAELYDRTASLVYGLALRILRVPEDAEEVAADVYLQAWRGASRFDSGRASVAGWLVMLARSRALDRLRARRVRVDSRTSDLGGIEPTSREPSPDSGLQQEWAARLVWTALSGLPPHERTLIELAFFEGLTHNELAVRVSLPLGTVKTRIRSGLQRIRGAIAPEARPAPPAARCVTPSGVPPLDLAHSSGIDQSVPSTVTPA